LTPCPIRLEMHKSGPQHHAQIGLHADTKWVVSFMTTAKEGPALHDTLWFVLQPWYTQKRSWTETSQSPPQNALSSVQPIQSTPGSCFDWANRLCKPDRENQLHSIQSNSESRAQQNQRFQYQSYLIIRRPNLMRRVWVWKNLRLASQLAEYAHEVDSVVLRCIVCLPWRPLKS
jgi:hypothetical protein